MNDRPRLRTRAAGQSIQIYMRNQLIQLAERPAFYSIVDSMNANR